MPGAKSDLEGLKAFDTNGNGLLDPGDAQWNNFRIWRDLNQDGISQPNEMQTLDQAGITSIGLTGTPTGKTAGPGQSVVTAQATFMRSNGLTGLVGDVSLATARIAAPTSAAIELGTAAVADTLAGTTASDYLDGRGAPAGTADLETGGGGADIYAFNPGYGSLTINNASQIDTTVRRQ